LRGLQVVKSVVTQTLVSEEQRIDVQRVGLLEIRRGRGAVRERPLFLLDQAHVRAVFCSATDTVTNALTALYERVYYHCVDGVFSVPYKPSYGSVSALLKPFTMAMRGCVVPSTPLSWMDFPSRYYVGRRLASYTLALDRLLSGGFKRSYSKLRSFLKHEKLPLGTKRIVPRLIQPRAPEYNIVVGCYIRHLEHKLYHDISHVFGDHPVVMKGYNAYQVGEFFHEAWDTYHDPVALGLDASRFDQHINPALLEWEHQHYTRHYPGDGRLKAYLHLQKVNSGWIRCPDGVLKYSVDGGRCSGDMNTALGNCLIMCGAVYSLCYGIHHRLPRRVRVFDNGDDCVIIGERDDVTLIRDAVVPFFDTLGLVMKVEPLVSRLEAVSFCQTQPVYDGQKWRMVRDPRLCLSKDVTFLNRTFASIGLSAQLHAIAECGLALTGGLPIMQAFYTSLPRGHKRVCGPIDPRFYDTGMFMMARGLAPHCAPVSTEARVSFWRAFGITPDLQMAIEADYDSAPPYGFDGIHEGFGEYVRM